MIGALITGILGGVMLLVDDFAGAYWQNYYAGTEGWVWIDPWGGAGVLIIPMALILFGSAAIAGMGMREPQSLTLGRLRFGFYGSLAVMVISILGGIAFAVHSVIEEYDDWWLDVGFYGGALGGLLTALIFYLALKQAKEQLAAMSPAAPLPYGPPTAQPMPPSAPPKAPPPEQPPGSGPTMGPKKDDGQSNR